MSRSIDHNEVDAALRNAGSTWSAAQAHGLLCSRLAVLGAEGGPDWFGLVLPDTSADSASHGDDLALLDDLYNESYRQLSQRQSEFEPLFPDDSESDSVIVTALAEWCEGFLHGLVSDVKGEDLKKALAAEPLSDIIKDMLEMTRASTDDNDESEDNKKALMELIEYLKVATQLVYEELAQLRRPKENLPQLPESDAIH
jgi:yecA family protein